MFLDHDTVISLARSGYIQFLDPRMTVGILSDDEIIRADAEGLLAGTDGHATIFGTCPVPECRWKDHAHFVVGDEERAAAHIELYESHSKTGCAHYGDLNLIERSAKRF